MHSAAERSSTQRLPGLKRLPKAMRTDMPIGTPISTTRSSSRNALTNRPSIRGGVDSSVCTMARKTTVTPRVSVHHCERAKSNCCLIAAASMAPKRRQAWCTML